MAKKKKKKPGTNKRVELAKLYQGMFGSEKGKYILYDLMGTHWMLNPTYSSDASEMAHREGERAVVLRILSILNINIERLYEEMEKREQVRQAETSLFID